MTLRRAATVLGMLVGLIGSSDALAAKRLVFKGTVIEGEPQKPDVAVFVSRQNLNKAYDLELKESFLPKIFESLTEEPF